MYQLIEEMLMSTHQMRGGRFPNVISLDEITYHLFINDVRERMCGMATAHKEGVGIDKVTFSNGKTCKITSNGVIGAFSVNYMYESDFDLDEIIKEVNCLIKRNGILEKGEEISVSKINDGGYLVEVYNDLKLVLRHKVIFATTVEDRESIVKSIIKVCNSCLEKARKKESRPDPYKNVFGIDDSDDREANIMFDELLKVNRSDINPHNMVEDCNKKESDSELKEVAKPVMDYIVKKHHPHTKIIIDCSSAEVLEGVKCFNIGSKQ